MSLTALPWIWLVICSANELTPPVYIWRHFDQTWEGQNRNTTDRCEKTKVLVRLKCQTTDSETSGTSAPLWCVHHCHQLENLICANIFTKGFSNNQLVFYFHFTLYDIKNDTGNVPEFIFICCLINKPFTGLMFADDGLLYICVVMSALDFWSMWW